MCGCVPNEDVLELSLFEVCTLEKSANQASAAGVRLPGAAELKCACGACTCRLCSLLCPQMELAIGRVPRPQDVVFVLQSLLKALPDLSGARADRS